MGYDVIVNGHLHRMEVREGETFRDLRARALRETEHNGPGYPDTDDWELRNHIGVLILGLDGSAGTLAERGWTRLWLNPRAGVGA